MQALELLANPEGATAMTQIKGKVSHAVVRSCCCCSTPAVFTVIVTSKVGVPRSVDVLMCEHHYRQCAPALTGLTPLVFDRDGYIVATAPRS